MATEDEAINFTKGKTKMQPSKDTISYHCKKEYHTDVLFPLDAIVVPLTYALDLLNTILDAQNAAHFSHCKNAIASCRKISFVVSKHAAKHCTCC